MSIEPLPRRRHLTVQMSVWFEDMAMDSTDAALEIVRSVVADLRGKCEEEIKQALADAGAKNVVTQMLAY